MTHKPFVMPRVRAAALIAFMAMSLVGTGCSQRGSKLPSAPQAPVEPAPVSDSPWHALDLLRWSLEHRNEERYQSLLTADYQFEFAATDSAGSAYRNVPWTRQDEIISVTNLFDSTTAIQLIFDGFLQAVADDRPGRMYPWHQMISVSNLTLTIIKADSTAWRVTGGARFYFVRGDSAVLSAGQQHDANRWYLERWVDVSNGGPGFAIQPVQPARTTPTRKVTLGSIKLYYRTLDPTDYP